jgi:hypothetical protein
MMRRSQNQGAVSIDGSPAQRSVRAGERQQDLARRLNKAGLLGKEGLAAVLGGQGP